MATEIKQILEKLDTMKSDIEYIKEHMVDIDSILTKDEEAILEKGIKEYKEGKTISLDNYIGKIKKYNLKFKN